MKYPFSTKSLIYVQRYVQATISKLFAFNIDRILLRRPNSGDAVQQYTFPSNQPTILRLKTDIDCTDGHRPLWTIQIFPAFCTCGMLERKTFHVISEEIVRSDVPPTTMDIPRTIYIYIRISHNFYKLTKSWKTSRIDHRPIHRIEFFSPRFDYKYFIFFEIDTIVFLFFSLGEKFSDAYLSSGFYN